MSLRRGEPSVTRGPKASLKALARRRWRLAASLGAVARELAAAGGRLAADEADGVDNNGDENEN